METTDSKQNYFMKLAQIAAQQSKCLKRKVGVVIVDADSHVLSLGYNGPPHKQKHCADCRQVPSRFILGPCIAVHSEINAILQARNSRHMYALYTTLFPCLNCVKVICSTSIKHIFYLTKKDPGSAREVTAEAITEMLNTAEICATQLEVK